MSTRQLRRLQQQRELERGKQLAAKKSDESEGDDDIGTPATRQRNLFAALGDENHGASKDEDQDDSDTVVGHEQAARSERQPETAIKKSKKKKSKNKGKNRDKSSHQIVGACADIISNNQEEDEIDRAIKELKITPREASITFPGREDDETATRVSQLFDIKIHHLKVANEMRSLFGRDIIESTDAEEQQESNRRRRGAVNQQVDLETFLREPPGAPKLPDYSLRRNIFVQGKDHWPRQSAGGLTMKEVSKAADGSLTEYAYVHDKNYDSMQALFFACVQMGDPMRLVHLLKRIPYHVSTLLQVSSVAKQDQNMALASELCERALFTFGRVTTSSFRQNIERGRARLDFRRPENRQFWLAGYLYLKSLVRKGTYRTALEWAKLLFSLDPKDPYGLRHYIHVLGIRAYEAHWLIDFVSALDQMIDNRDVMYLRQSLVLAKLQIGDMAGARNDVIDGMKRVPWLYCALFQELGLDTPPSIWGVNAESDARSFWVKLYLHQAKDLWANAAATRLVQDVAKGLDRVDVTKLPLDDAPPDLGTIRLVYLEGQTTLLGLAPKDLLERQPNYEFDPLPPAEEDNIFSSEGVQLPWRQAGHGLASGNSDQLLADMENWARRQGVFMEDDGEDDEIRALREADDEELRRDIEAQFHHANEPGVMDALLQMLGMGWRRELEAEEESEAAEDEGSDQGSLQDLQQSNTGAQRPPGAWPADQDD
ncbi:hypothetical protein CDD81_6110 [Ophiocordyceps australis]|uniref:Ribosome quality control complex subunit 1 n=1 Tax=Ophiocordyceps australis TaxID=1399860 RepID=A0A2C5Y6J9_9HYPO|nr:hypothetical protein CDD81_6110 [Ophiocordyceps australis]